MKHKIVLIPFPFDDLSAQKVRPAVCLTEPIGSHRHVIVAFITSRIVQNPLSSDVVLHHTDSDFNQTGLRISSTLQLHRLATLTTRVIKRDLGKLPESKVRLVEQKLHSLFDL